MTVKEMYCYLSELIKEGKGDYKLTCDGGINPIGKGIVYDDLKEIEVG